MKSACIVSFTALVILVMSACAPPAENTERSAVCKEAGNTKMCSICCKTKSSTYTMTGITGSCACFGDLEK